MRTDKPHPAAKTTADLTEQQKAFRLVVDEVSDATRKLIEAVEPRADVSPADEADGWEDSADRPARVDRAAAVVTANQLRLYCMRMAYEIWGDCSKTPAQPGAEAGSGPDVVIAPGKGFAFAVPKGEGFQSFVDLLKSKTPPAPCTCPSCREKPKPADG